MMRSTVRSDLLVDDKHHCRCANPLDKVNDILLFTG